MEYASKDALDAGAETPRALDIHEDASEPSASDGLDEDRSQLPLVSFGFQRRIVGDDGERLT
jgi:hypothetical protein